MRQIVLDTETTGLEPAQGHRIIEIGCVELVNRRLTRRHFHQYLQPDRAVDSGAQEVHGISDEFLRDKPRFPDVVEEFLAFIEGAELIIHNAPFDVGFLDHELGLLGEPRRRIADLCGVLDTLVLARQLYPGQKNNLDALCRRLDVDNSQRELHGALLDAEILADVYLAMTGGQAMLQLGEGHDAASSRPVVHQPVASDRPTLPVIRATDAELAAHRSRLEAIEKASGDGCLWTRLEEGEAPG